MRKLAVALISTLLFAFPLSASAAIAFDAASTWHTTTSSQTLTFSFTTGSGTNRMMMAFSNSTNNDMSATYNGVSMQKVAVVQNSSTGRWFSLFALPAPTTGANTFTFSGTASEAILQGGVTSYSGVAQATLMDATTTLQQASTSVPYVTTITTATNNDWTVLAVGCSGGTVTSITAGTNSTQRNNGGFTGMFDSNAAITPAGNFSMSINPVGPSSGSGCFSIMAALAPAVVSSTNFIFNWIEQWWYIF